MEIRKVIVSIAGTNCYIISEGDKCVIMDPGADAEKIKNFVSACRLKPEAVLLTHGHFDHIMAVDAIRDYYGIRVYAPSDEKDLLNDCRLNCSYDLATAYETEADVYLKDGECLMIAGIEFKLLHTPGHTEGSSCYYVENENVLFSGDTLFFRSVGRSDFPTGDGYTLMKSLSKLMKLPEETIVYCGHGPKTEIGSEKRENPYIRG